MNPFRFTKLAILLNLLVVVFVLSTYSPADSSPPPQPLLPGSRWELVSLGPAGEQSPVAPATKLTLVLQERDRLNGSAGCNTFAGTYTVDGNKMAVSRLASTLKACADPGLMAQEARYLTALRKASGYRLDKAGGTLGIDYDAGRGKLHFVRLGKRP